VSVDVAVAKSDAAPASPGFRSVALSPAAFGDMFTRPSMTTIAVTLRQPVGCANWSWETARAIR
jgi:hypothetical protein